MTDRTDDCCSVNVNAVKKSKKHCQLFDIDWKMF